MEDLIAALTIFLKYLHNKNGPCPTHCGHDVLMIMEADDNVSDEDARELNRLGFHWSDSDDSWISYRYGSA